MHIMPRYTKKVIPKFFTDLFKKLEQMMCFCNCHLVAKCLNIPFKIGSAKIIIELDFVLMTLRSI